MRFRLGVLVVVLLAVGGLRAAAADSPPAATQIAVVNQSQVDNGALATYLPYFQQAVDQLCSHWGCHAVLSLGAPSAGEWVATLNQTSDVPGAIGYHTEVGGVPTAYVSVQTAVQNGLPWGVVFTHELDEMLVDPEAAAADNTYCTTDPGTGMETNCQFYMREVGDPVQGYWYRLGPVRVTDFVTPAWFESDARGPYDALRKLSAPLTLGRQAYDSEYVDGAWTQNSTFFKNWDRFGEHIR